MSSLSFKFSKTSEKKVLTDSKLRDISTKDNDEERDFIKDVKDKAIIGTLKTKDVNKPLVIPLIKQNHWRTSKPEVNVEQEVKELKPAEAENEEQRELSLMEEAAKEIMEETTRELNEWEGRTDKGRLDQLPTVIANAAPSSFENDEHLDVSLRAEASTLEDYESVPIEQYGLAMLRGMGWKPGEGIGGYKKEVVQIFDPQSRPKGLGLGATRPKNDQAVVKEGEEKLTLKRGAFVLVEGGAKRGMYGEVEGLDEENGRVLLKMGLGKEIASVSENVIKLVTKTEFKEKGKVLNLDKYEKYKEKDRIKKEEEERSRQRTPEKRRYKDGEKCSRKSRSCSRDYDKNDRYDRSPEVKRIKKGKTWVRPQLRVRCIDSKVKGGKYYNIKMEVLDVVTSDSCDCRTDEGKLVENIRTDKVETLIPKKDGGRVMVVRGERKGEIGQVIGRDKGKYMATVQLYQSEDVLSLDYDSVCEYLGEVPDDD